MKKLLAVSLALVSSLAMLTGCKDKDDDSSKGKVEKPTITAESTHEVGAKQDKNTTLLSDLMKKVENSNRTLDTTYTIMGMTVDMYYTANADCAYSEVNMFGVNVVTLDNKDGSYVLVPEHKKYYKPEEATETEDAVAEFLEGLGEYEASYDYKIDGKSYTSEKFVDEEGVVSYLVFFEDGSVIAAESIEGEEVLFFPLEISAEVDESKFKLPSDYSEMTEEEYMEMLWGDVNMEGAE